MIYATKRAKFHQMKESGVVHAGQKRGANGRWFMQLNCFRLVRFDRFNRKEIS